MKQNLHVNLEIYDIHESTMIYVFTQGEDINLHYS